MTDEEARHRHRQLTGVRLTGAATVLLGAAVLSGRWVDWPMVGYGLILLGAVEFFALPQWLLRQWKAGEE